MKCCIAIVLAGLGVGVLGGCAGGRGHSEPVVVSAPTPQQEAVFNQLKTLDGKWAAKGKGMEGQIVFNVSSNGTVVREVMFPGTPHEMTNLYHLDGPSVMMTHYCAMGNQPHLRSTGASTKEIGFHTDSVSNLTSADEMYMGDMTLAFVDKDHVTESWSNTDHGKKAAPMAMELTRMK